MYLLRKIALAEGQDRKVILIVDLVFQIVLLDLLDVFVEVDLFLDVPFLEHDPRNIYL